MRVGPPLTKVSERALGFFREFCRPWSPLIILATRTSSPMKQLYTLLLVFSLNSAMAQSAQLWGMTTLGGANDMGSIFRMSTDGSDFQVVFSFDSISGSGPEGGLCLAPNGKLYGMTNNNGVNDVGTLFSISTTTLAFDKIMDLNFGMGAFPWGSMILGSDGMLYGTGIGDLFRLDPATDSFTSISNHGVVEGLLQASNGIIYGGDAYSGTNGDGLIFSFDPADQQTEELHSFNTTDGKTPYGKLCEADNGKLYGMTYQGGANDDGVIYAYDPVGGTLNVVLDFDGSNGHSPWSCMIPIGPDRLLGSVTLGGTTGGGALFELTPSTGQFVETYAFGYSPNLGTLLFGGIIQGTDGMVYGMAASGGSGGGGGTVYQYHPGTHSVSVLHNFTGGSNGTTPHGELTYVGPSVQVAEIESPDGVKVFPNPAEGSATVTLSGLGRSVESVMLTDATGRSVWQGEPGLSIQQLTLPASPGVYMLTYGSAGSRSTKRIVVR